MAKRPVSTKTDQELATIARAAGVEHGRRLLTGKGNDLDVSNLRSGKKCRGLESAALRILDDENVAEERFGPELADLMEAAYLEGAREGVGQ